MKEPSQGWWAIENYLITKWVQVYDLTLKKLKHGWWQKKFLQHLSRAKLSSMEEVPIILTYQARTYSGEFHPVSGAGSNQVWFLVINNFYNGPRCYMDGRWLFHSQTRKFEDLAEYFGEYMLAWYQWCPTPHITWNIVNGVLLSSSHLILLMAKPML